MKKLMSLVVVLSILLSFGAAFAKGTESFPPIDPQYGQKHTASLLADAMNKIESASSAGTLSSVNALSLKKNINALTDLLLKKATRNDGSDEAKERSSEISKSLEEINGVLGLTRGNGQEAVKAIKADVDAAATAAGNFDSCNGLSDAALKGKLNELIKDHRSLGYNQGRQVLFTKIDSVDGKVTCVYTGRTITCNSIPSANPPQAMNTEHTWPKSLGAGSEPAKSDLNHLYPTDTFANSTRSSYPFGNVDENSASWKQGGSYFDGDTFMPREDHRGKVARAYFYFSTRYNIGIPDGQEKTIKEWHEKYPVTQEERERNDKVFQFQGNRNPFVDRPEFVKKISNF